VNDTKRLNDSIGHREVDLGLFGLASRLKLRLRRLGVHFVLFQPQAGGDEFVIFAWMFPEQLLAAGLKKKMNEVFTGKSELSTLEQLVAKIINNLAVISLPGSHIPLSPNSGVAAHAFDGSEKPQQIAVNLRANAEQKLKRQKERRVENKLELMRQKAEELPLEEFIKECIEILHAGRINGKLLFEFARIIMEKTLKEPKE
jgi:GGDEF domain-containing protein